jgi:hypothetical protein
MTVCERYRQPWSAGEVNRLWNEYEIRQLPILQIAKLHKRGEYAILHKLAKEGAILETWSDVKGWTAPTEKQHVFFSVDEPVKVNNTKTTQVTVDCDDDMESLEDNDDPTDEDYIYESDEDDEDYSVVDSEEDECSVDSDSDSDYQDDASSVDSDSDYEDETENEEFDAYSIKQKSRFLHTIISALKFFVYAA